MMIKRFLGSQKFWLLFYLICAWFLLLAAAQNHRSYQDTWALESLLLIFSVFIIAFIAVVNHWINSGYFVLLVSTFVIIIRWIIGLKYSWLYGTAIDQIFHPSSVNYLVETGFPVPATPYTNVPGFHAFFAIVAMISKISAEDVIDYSFPVLIGLIPLIIYNFCRVLRLDNGLTNQIILLSVVAFDPYLLTLQGSTFGAFFIILIVLFFFTRETSVVNQRFAYTVLIFLTTFSLLFSHGISSLFFMALITITSVVFSVWVGFRLMAGVSQKSILSNLTPRMRQLSIFMIVLFICWWMYQARWIFEVFIEQVLALITEEGVTKAPVPNRIFQLDLKNALWMLWMLHGNTIILVVLSILGVVTYLKIRDSLPAVYRYLLYGIMVIAAGLVFVLGVQLLSGFGNLEYMRLIVYGVTLTPFITGLLFWRLYKANSTLWLLSFALVMILSLMQVFPYQPWVPSGKLLFDYIDEDQPVLYMHSVVTSYQETMLNFASTHHKENAEIFGDLVTIYEALKFWGVDYFWWLPIQRDWTTFTELDGGNWELLLIHRPGKSGPLGEPVELRHTGEINRILQKPGRSLIYDNGESYILMR
jgi:hypothetical protein